MFEIFGISTNLILAQMTIGLFNGSFYSLLSLGVAVIFGVLRIVNFAHGAQFMLGGLVGWALLSLPQLAPSLGLPSIGYWGALLLVPLILGLFGIILERTIVSRIYDVDHAYGLLLTIGLALVIESGAQILLGASGKAYAPPAELTGSWNSGFMSLPIYRAWVIGVSLVICLATWFVIERTKFGALLRAGTENPVMVEAFGIDVQKMLTLTYGAGVALAGFAGIMAAPIYQVNPEMGQNIVIVVFAVVVIGGMGSVLGAVIAGYMLGMVEGLARVVWPEATSTVVFFIMTAVLLWRPSGIFGRQ